MFAVPLGLQVVSVFAIVVIVAWFEGHGLVEQLARVCIIPSFYKCDLLHGLYQWGRVPSDGRPRAGHLWLARLAREKLPLGFGYGVALARAASEIGVVSVGACESNSGRSRLRIGGDPFFNAADMKFVVGIAHLAFMGGSPKALKNSLFLQTPPTNRPLSVRFCSAIFSSCAKSSSVSNTATLALYPSSVFSQPLWMKRGRRRLVAAAVVMKIGLHNSFDRHLGRSCVAVPARACSNGKNQGPAEAGGSQSTESMSVEHEG